MHPVEVVNAVRKIITETNKKNPFVDNRPGKKWLQLFLQRNPERRKY